MLAFPHPGTVRAEFMLKVVDLVQAEGTRVASIAQIQTGPGIGMARNNLTAEFLKSPAEWLFMLDTDMVISLGTLPALLEAADPEERPVVGALCCVINENQVRTTVYTASRDEAGEFAFRHLLEWPHDTILRVDATGCACMIMHRNAFKRISEAHPEEDGLWFAEMVVGKHQLGEDLSFCLRCSMAEIPVFVHTGVEVGHMKTLQLGNVTP